MPKVIGITGYAQAGKSSVAEAIQRHHAGSMYNARSVAIMGFADTLRQMALGINPVISGNVNDEHVRYADAVALYGYEATKVVFQEARAFLQRLGTEGVRDVLGDDFWVHTLYMKICESKADIVVVPDVRFENEVDYIKWAGELWAVSRPNNDSGVGPEHASESYVAQAMARADHTIVNDGSLGQLEFDVKDTIMNGVTLQSARTL